MSKQEQVKAFIVASLVEGQSREAIEDALVNMCLAKSYSQAKRLITLASK